MRQVPILTNISAEIRNYVTTQMTRLQSVFLVSHRNRAEMIQCTKSSFLILIFSLPSSACFIWLCPDLYLSTEAAKALTFSYFFGVYQGSCLRSISHFTSFVFCQQQNMCGVGLDTSRANLTDLTSSLYFKFSVNR